MMAAAALSSALGCRPKSARLAFRVVPTALLNIRAKCAWSENPARNRISIARETSRKNAVSAVDSQDVPQAMGETVPAMAEVDTPFRRGTEPFRAALGVPDS